jgi:hypothetical protein
MRRIVAIALALAGLAGAQETRQDRGKRVVMEGLKALGGDAYLRMENRVESGRLYSFYREQISGLSVATIYTRYLAPVAGKIAVQERESFGLHQDEGAVLLTEEGGWEWNYHGVRTMEPDRYKTFVDSTLHNILYIMRQRLQEPGMSFYSEGADVYEREPVEMVDITDADNFTVTVYFSQITKLPIRQVSRRRNEQFHDFDTEVTSFGKYRPVGGIQWPYDVWRERNGDKVFEMYSESVEIDKNLKSNLFTLPNNTKMMKKGK